MSQFQGVLALIERMSITKTIDVSTTETLVASLSKLPLNDGRHGAAIADWMNRDLRKPSLMRLRRRKAAVTPLRISRALSRAHWRAREVPARLQPREFHGRDRSIGSTWRHQKSSACSVFVSGRALHVSIWRLTWFEVAGKLDGGSMTVADVLAAVEALKRIALDTAPSSPAGFNVLRRSHEIIERAADELSKLKTKSDLQRAVRIAEGLRDLADEVLADALLSWAYAVSIADADSPVLLVGNVARRHDFGIGRSERGMRPHLEWAQPRQRISAGLPWHVSGSLLGLELALSSQALRRVNAERVSRRSNALDQRT